MGILEGNACSRQVFLLGWAPLGTLRELSVSWRGQGFSHLSQGRARLGGSSPPSPLLPHNCQRQGHVPSPPTATKQGQPLPPPGMCHAIRVSQTRGKAAWEGQAYHLSHRSGHKKKGTASTHRQLGAGFLFTRRQSPIRPVW